MYYYKIKNLVLLVNNQLITNLKIIGIYKFLDYTSVTWIVIVTVLIGFDLDKMKQQDYIKIVTM